MSRLFIQTKRLHAKQWSQLMYKQIRFCAMEEASIRVQEILENKNKNIITDQNTNITENTNDLGIYKRIKYSKSVQEIDELLLEYEPQFIKLRKTQYCDPLRYPTMHKLYPAAIEQCAYLNEEKKAWDLFNICKERNILSGYIYSVMMWVTMRFNPTKQGLNKVFDLFHEMKNETTLIPTAMLDAALINSCVAVREYEKGYDVLSKIKQNKNSHILLSSQRLCTSICRLYVMSDNIDNGLRFLFNNYKTCKMVPSSKQCHFLLSGIAKNIDMNTDPEQKERYLFYAQKLFDFAFNKNKGVSPPILVYNPYIHIFAKIGDYNTCVEFIRCMVNNEDYPNPDIICCCTALSSFIFLNYQEGSIDVVTQNKLIQEIIEIMDELNIERNRVYYGILMKISRQQNDIKKLFGYYKQMEYKTSQDVKRVSIYATQCFDDMRKTQNMDNEIGEFKSWIIEEYKTHNTLPLTEKESDLDKFSNIVHNAL